MAYSFTYIFASDASVNLGWFSLIFMDSSKSTLLLCHLIWSISSNGCAEVNGIRSWVQLREANFNFTIIHAFRNCIQSQLHPNRFLISSQLKNDDYMTFFPLDNNSLNRNSLNTIRIWFVFYWRHTVHVTSLAIFFPPVSLRWNYQRQYLCISICREMAKSKTSKPIKLVWQ